MTPDAIAELALIETSRQQRAALALPAKDLVMSLHVEHSLSIDDLPLECIKDCSSPGRVDDAVAFWRETLNFTVDRGRAIEHLSGYGSWTARELEESDDDEIADRILWLACGDFSEYVICCERENVDPFGQRPDDFDPSSGSDVFFLDAA
jgi:hypothetical protein